MKFLFKILKDFPAYLWSGWGAIASILLFIACWDLGNQIYGNLVLPSPLETFKICFTFSKNINFGFLYLAILIISSNSKPLSSLNDFFLPPLLNG